MLISIVFTAACYAEYHTVSRNSYVNLTVQETWDLLSNTANGIHIPIDVRRDDEWKVEHINTPIPENPIHYPLSELENPTGLQIFFSIYEGKEIILYCRTGSRSVTAANILIANGFNGTIYNMLGGITAWKAAGLPTHANQIPSVPAIDGPAQGKPGVSLTYTFQSVDPDGEDIYYCINWNDGTNEICIGPYASGDVIDVSHSWSQQGTYVVQAKALDVYDDESDWGTLTVRMPRIYGLELWQWITHHFPLVSILLSFFL
jgi:rhodanese-related sulfurtransferase